MLVWRFGLGNDSNSSIIAFFFPSGSLIPENIEPAVYN